jgi:trigger factor
MIEIGSGQFVPGFEDQLIDAKAGETRTIKITFPEDYGSKDLAGKDAEFEIAVKEIHELKMPELTDELAKSMGDESADAFKARMRQFLQDNYNGASRLRLKRQLLDKLAEAHHFPVPQGLVDVEFDAIWRQMERVKNEGQLDPEDEGKSDDELKAEYRAIAERRVRLGLLLSDVGQKNGVSVSQEDLNRAIMQEAMKYPGQETAVIEYYQRTPQALETLRAPIFEDKVVDYIIGQAKVTDQPATIEEVMRDPEDDVPAPAAEAAKAEPAADSAEKPKKARKSAKAKE